MSQNTKMSAKERFKLKHFIKDLKDFRGRGTELVSVYVPAGYDLSKVIGQMQDEQGTATNIKSSSTRKNVIDALERMIQHLKVMERTPKNGLAAFSGNVSAKEGQSDVQVWSIEPPLPTNQRLYRCDKHFILDPLEDMADDENTFGMIVLDKRDGAVALLKGKTIIPLASASSAVPGKHKTGGQSAQRFERLRDGAAKEFYRRVAEYAKKEFLGNTDIKGILLGGPGRSKDEFLEQGQVQQEIKDKIINVVDLSYTGDFGLQELLERSVDVLAGEDVAGEKQIMQKFFYELSRDTGKYTYGEEQVRKAIELGAVDVLLLSEKVPDEVISELEQAADSMGSETQLISTETREGGQLEKMGGIAAILRYAVEL